MLRSRRFFREGQCDNFDCPEGSQTIKKLEFSRDPGVTPPSHVTDSMMMIIWLTILSDIVISKDTVISKRPDGRNLVLTFAMDAVLQKLTGFSPYHRVLLDPIVYTGYFMSLMCELRNTYISVWYTIPILHGFISCGPGLVPGMGCYWFIPN